MGKYKVFNGTAWVDICDCNVHIRNANNAWQLLDPKNCPTKYWTGTEWCEIICCECAQGFTLDDATGYCEKTTRIQAIPTSSFTSYPVLQGSTETVYGNFGARLYDNITNAVFPVNAFGNSPYIARDAAGTGTLYNNTVSNVNNNIFNTQNTSDTKGRLNYSSILAAGYVDDTWFTVTFCITITTPKTYIFGLGADNQARASITSSTFNGGVTSLNIVNLWDSGSPTGSPTTLHGRPFNWWHMFPIDLPAGNHTFELAGMNFGSSAALGAEVYDISITDLQALMASTTATPADFAPYVIFTTADLVQNPPLEVPAPGSTPTYSCPSGTTFTSCYGVPQCVVDSKYICEDTLTCTSGGLTGSGSAGIYKVPLLIPANVCDVQITFDIIGVPDSLAILDFSETTVYAQSGYFGDCCTPALGSYTFAPLDPIRKIYIYSSQQGGIFNVDLSAPPQTLEIIANEFPITNTDPNKIPLSYNPANPTQTTRVLTWNKGVTPNDEIVMIRIVGHPTQGTGWSIQTLTCVNC